MTPIKRLWLASACLFVLALSACGGGGGGGKDGTTTGSSTAKTHKICGPESQKQALIAFFEAREGDTIEFCEGQHDFTTGLTMTGKRGITIRGAGMDKTILSFANSPAQDGINVNQTDGFTIEDITVYDAPGNGVRVFRSEHVTFSRVKIGWSNADPVSPNYDPSMESWKDNGAYAFYPVVSRYILIEDSVSVGSSDAGVYIGQSSDILVRRTEAFHNVAGFEFENTYRAEYVDNIAHSNVGGFLVFDLPGRVQFGEKNLVHRNKTYNNNIPQFAPRGSIVAVIPPGTGMLMVATDQVEVYDNEIYDNDTVGIAIVNYGLADPNEPATNYDFYPEGIHVYNNVFRNNGTNPSLPDTERSGCLGDPNNPIIGLPGLGENPECLADNATVLPTILLVKNAGKGAHIFFDGGEDVPNDCDQIPVDRDGIPLTEPNPNEKDRPEPRTDERGRPNLYQFDPIPVCKWNAWKFDEQGQLKKPENGLCIENNSFENTTNPTIDPYSNVHFSTPDPTDPANLEPADNTIPTDCPIVAPEILPQYVPALPSFKAKPGRDPRPSKADINRVCSAGEPGEINMEAVLNYNCPRLEQYGLYKDETDPRKGATAPGIPFDLNSILFSDYASKYRFLFLPKNSNGQPIKAKYQDSQNCDTLNIYDCYSQSLKFPVGTVLSKTFAFKDGENEEVIETRLLIKRQNADGSVYWVGLPYEWTVKDGKKVALLKIEGNTKSVTWDYPDPDPEVVDGLGERRQYSGSTDRYAVPDAGACILCHNGDDLEAGSPPIGPKVRNLNRDYDYGGNIGVMNQLAYMQMKGLLNLPDDPANLERLPKWDIAGSTGETPNSPADIHHRARAYLEVNCYHCHNPAGNAQNSGLVLDFFTNPMTQRQGICKAPIAAGKAADFGAYDIQPGNAAQSILPLRVATTESGAMMPPLARSVAHAEVVELLMDWVDNVVSGFADPDANSCGTSGGLPLPSTVLPSEQRIEPTPAQKAPFG